MDQTPEDQVPLEPSSRINESRRRRTRRVIVPSGRTERAIYVNEIASRLVPAIEYYLFSMLCAVVLGAGDEAMVARLAHRLVDPANHFGEELAVEVGQQHADGVGAPHHEGAGRAVRHVAHPRRHAAHAGQRLARHEVALVHGTRDGRHRDAGGARNIADRDRGSEPVWRTRPQRVCGQQGGLQAQGKRHGRGPVGSDGFRERIDVNVYIEGCQESG